MDEQSEGTACFNFDNAMNGAEAYNADLLVIGSGIAGLYAAIKASSRKSVILISKGELTLSNTYYAQGGIAAAICHMDTTELHLKDTLVAGAGLCAHDAVKVMVEEGVDRIYDILRLGVDFDRDGEILALTREGAHSRRRILHAHGDATGREIATTLIEIVRNKANIKVIENCYIADLMVSGEGICTGAKGIDTVSGKGYLLSAEAVMLSSGGLGQVYKYTTNPPSATGDGVAMSFRAGALVADMEFHQFHPTALYMPELNPSFLISEAVRGEGGKLINADGRRFMPDYHDLAELAPRDIVARSIVKEMAKTGKDFVYLDLTDWGKPELEKRFPTIYHTLIKHGIDMTAQLIPVAPVAHYMMGGVVTDLCGRTSVKGLFACGEVACTGVHGANRLASNSLLEGLVFANRAVSAAIENPCKEMSTDIDLLRGAKRNAIDKNAYEFKSPREPNIRTNSIGIKDEHQDDSVESLIHRLKEVMWDHVGITRSGRGLYIAREEILGLISRCRECRSIPQNLIECLKLRSMAQVSLLMAEAAIVRTESRGAHYREDYPKPHEEWLKRVVMERE